MIKVYVVFPNHSGSTFDMDYYLNKHIPMVRQKLGAALKGMSVDHALSGAQPGIDAAYRVITALTFDSVDAFERAFTPFAGEITGDIPHFTDIVPSVQISEVKL
jgi:uncharacterized protein (TIGR02118 family)